MTQRRSEDAHSRFFRELFLATALETYELILILDLDTMRCTALTATAEGFAEDGAPCAWADKERELLETIHPEDRSEAESRWAPLLAAARPGARCSATFRSSLRREPGNYGWWKLIGRVLSSDGRPTLVMLLNDVTEDMNERQKLLDRSERDGLTGLYNRARLAELLEGPYRRLRSCGVVFMDLNELKEVNDAFGHEAGDRMILMGAESFRGLAGPGVTPFRYGGDEFLLVAENVSREETNRLVRSWMQRWRQLQAGSEFNFSAAVGSAWAEGSPDTAALIEKADADMYRNKHLMKAGILPDISDGEGGSDFVGLYGRRDFFSGVRSWLAHAEGRPFCILSLGIGHFPLINKWYGREVGDRVLRDVAECVRDFAQAHGGLGCYLESESFAMLLPADEALPRQLDARLRAILREISPSVGFLLSIGVYPVTDPNMKISAMLDYAAEARSRVAPNSAERVFFFDLRRPVVPKAHPRLLEELKAGLDAGDLDYWLQPVCAPADGTVTGAEMLARWSHPSWGLVEPELFIPALEAAGLTAELDPVLWERAAARLRSWREAGLKPVPLTVNVSLSDVLSVDVAGRFLRLAEQYGLEKSLLQAAFRAEELVSGEALPMMAGLRTAGFPVLLDVSADPDFPLEPSLPADLLRANLRAFTREDPEAAVRDLLIRAGAIRRPVILAGVETEEQAAMLLRLGAAGAQGFRFHKPMPAEDFAALLRRGCI